jgi:hypothetical protein
MHHSKSNFLANKQQKKKLNVNNQTPIDFNYKKINLEQKRTQIEP